MKIKRTLPSVNAYLPKHLSYTHNNTSTFQQSLSSTHKNPRSTYPKSANKAQPITPHHNQISLSTSKPIPQHTHNSSQNRSSTLRKTVTFANFVDTSPKNQKFNQFVIHNKQNHPLKNKIKRKKIFNNSIDRHAIPVNLSFKQVADIIKKKQQQSINAQNNTKILTKILNLQDLVKDIQHRLNTPKQTKNQQLLIEQKSTLPTNNIQNYPQAPPYHKNSKQSASQNNIIKMQLQQIKRCQQIAKQNQLLYNQLAKKIQIKSNNLFNQTNPSFFHKLSNSSQQCQHQNRSKSKYKFTNDNHKSNRKKTPAFQDFNQFQLNQLQNSPRTDSAGQIPITSPFFLPAK